MQTLIAAGADEIAEQIRLQVLELQTLVSRDVADAVTLSVISGAAAGYRESSTVHPNVQAYRLRSAIGAGSR